MSSGTKTLYERLGGYTAIAAWPMIFCPGAARAILEKTASCAKSSSSARTRAVGCTIAAGTWRLAHRGMRISDASSQPSLHLRLLSTTSPGQRS
jgi:hypothetical protein